MCSCVRSTVLRIFEPSDRASDGSDLILTMNGSGSLIVEMKSELSDAQSDDSEVCSTVLCTFLAAQHQPEVQFLEVHSRRRINDF